jgi:rubredoxin
MAKYRCPTCGAAHKEPVSTCRMCGYIMDGSVAMPTTGNVARQVPQRRKGVAGFAIVGVLIVIALAAAALALHATSQDKAITNLEDKIPGVKTDVTGWKTVTDTEGGFTVSMPPGATTTSVAFAPVSNGQLTGWLGQIGQSPEIDSQLYVVHAKAQALPGESVQDSLSRLGDAKVAQDGGFVESKSQTSYQGYPALDYKISRVNFAGQQGYEHAVMFIKGDALYVIESVSRYPSNPSFSTVADSLRFTA